MNHDYRRIGLVSIATLLAAPTLAVAKAQLPFSSDDTVRVGAGYAYSSADAFGRSELGQITDDLRRDVVYGKATSGQLKLYLAAAPGVYDSVGEVLDTNDVEVLCKDFCILPGAGSDGPDGILISVSAGLEILAWDEDERKFSRTPIPDTSGWGNLKRLRVGNLDGDSIPDVVGLASSDYTLRVIYDLTPLTSSPATVVFDPQTATTIFEFVLVEWDGQDNQEVAMVALSGGFVVAEFDYNLSGQPLGTSVFSTGGTGQTSDVLVPVDYPGSTRDRVAFVTKLPNNNRVLYVATNPPGGSASMIYCANFGAIPVVGGAAANLDGDVNNRPELVLSQCLDTAASTNDEILMLKHLDVGAETASATYSISAGNYLIMDAGNPSTDPHTSWPATGDVDNDGDNDIVYAVEDSTSPFVAVMTSRYINKATRVPTIEDGVWSGEFFSDLTIDLDLLAPTVQLEPGTGHTKALQVTVWLHDAGGPDELLPDDPETVLDTTSAITSSWTTYDLALHYLDADDATPNVNSLVVRELEMNGSTIVKVGPDTVWSIATDDYLNGVVKPQFGGVVFAVPIPQEGLPEGNLLMGALPLGRVPRFSMGVLPK